ncbi:hypothetical protein [Algivirga pacifica]|uniref:Metal-dependent HD superfamily phosphohydrolase n=1 Tax=Algivirga pacifica TaxID=1162670 RepID=A0ABP9DF79_9BACT
MNTLQTTWHELLSKYSASESQIKSLWNEIEAAYTHKSRHYHNLHHLQKMSDFAQKYQVELIDPDTLLFTIFYHDIVYKSTRKDNEAKSAVLGAKRLTEIGYPTEKIEQCKKQILATQTHTTSEEDTDTQFLLDFDLAILGMPFPEYEVYTKNVRKEYSMYPDFLYQPGRKKVLQHFLEMEIIFKTAVMREQLEEQARKNLSKELATYS